MSLGERLYELRKNKGLSQEEVAERLNVTRQTISKWETDESKPDFEKIIPICNLFNISSTELLTGERSEREVRDPEEEFGERKKKKALYISLGTLLYSASIIWIIIGEEVFHMNDGIIIGIFLLICAMSTCVMIYQGITFSSTKKTKEEIKDQKLKSIIKILSKIFCVIYLTISFITFSWHITWIIWIIYAVVKEITILIYNMRREENGD